MTLTDAAYARRMLEAAVAMTTNPTLTEAQVDDLMTLAASLDDDLNTVYTEAGLNRAAAMGWQIKAGLTSDRYDLGGGPGRTLDESQWHQHCAQMVDRYRTGTWSVTGGSGTRRGGGIGSISLVSAHYTDEVS
jgi:hypothetical protein